MQKIIKRRIKNKVKKRLKNNPAVALLGARQVGKSTLAREILSEYPDLVFIDLAKAWNLKFEKYRINLQNRKNTNKIQMSSGEKFLLVLMRFWAHWEGDVKCIFSDECDAFLDVETKNLYYKTLNELAGNHIVFFVGHSIESTRSKEININNYEEIENVFARM